MSLGMMHRFMSGIMNVFLTTKKDDDNDHFFIIFHVLYLYFIISATDCCILFIDETIKFKQQIKN